MADEKRSVVKNKKDINQFDSNGCTAVHNAFYRIFSEDSLASWDPYPMLYAGDASSSVDQLPSWCGFIPNLEVLESLFSQGADINILRRAEDYIYKPIDIVLTHFRQLNLKDDSEIITISPFKEIFELVEKYYRIEKVEVGMWQNVSLMETIVQQLEIMRQQEAQQAKEALLDTNILPVDLFNITKEYILGPFFKKNSKIDDQEVLEVEKNTPALGSS